MLVDALSNPIISERNLQQQEYRNRTVQSFFILLFSVSLDLRTSSASRFPFCDHRSILSLYCSSACRKVKLEAAMSLRMSLICRSRRASCFSPDALIRSVIFESNPWRSTAAWMRSSCKHLSNLTQNSASA